MTPASRFPPQHATHQPASLRAPALPLPPHRQLPSISERQIVPVPAPPLRDAIAPPPLLRVPRPPSTPGIRSSHWLKADASPLHALFPQPAMQLHATRSLPAPPSEPRSPIAQQHLPSVSRALSPLKQSVAARLLPGLPTRAASREYSFPRAPACYLSFLLRPAIEQPASRHPRPPAEPSRSPPRSGHDRGGRAQAGLQAMAL